MKAWVAVIAPALLLAGPTDGAATERAGAGDARLRRTAEKLQAAADAAGRGDCATAAKLAGELVDRNRAQLPDELLAAGLNLAAICEVQLGKSADAYRHAVAATAFPEADDFVWRIRLAFEIDAKRTDAALATVEAMTQGRGAALNAIPIAWFYQFDNGLKRAGADAQRRRLLKVLTDNSYSPDEPGATADGFRHRYAEMLADAGDREAARQLIGRIEYPGNLIDISLDPRFRDMLPPDFDLRASVERALERAKVVAAQNPELIAPVNDVAMYLQVLGRPQESLAVLDALRPSIDEPDKLTDRDERLVWWWDGRSRAHEMLGDFAQAAEALKRGGEAKEAGGLNVSQVINLSQLQLSYGRHAEALATLRVFDDGGREATPYGMMQVATTRGCAKARVGTPADAAADLAYAKAHAKDSPDALTELLLCLGDKEGAAASLVGRLDDADTRAGALRALSDYDPPPAPRPADPRDERLATVKARPEVQAAIARAGGIRRFRVQDIPF